MVLFFIQDFLQWVKLVGDFSITLKIRNFKYCQSIMKKNHASQIKINFSEIAAFYPQNFYPFKDQILKISKNKFN
jgi:hypothetical protein